MSKSVNKTELAKQYGWGQYFLTKKINTIPGLLDELKKEADYKLYQRVFTRKQLEIIYKYLGNPNIPLS